MKNKTSQICIKTFLEKIGKFKRALSLSLSEPSILTPVAVTSKELISENYTLKH